MKGLHRIQWFSIFLLAFCLTACQVKRPKVVLSDAKMENVLYDYHIAKAMGEEVPYTDGYKRVLYIESVFKKHGITQAEFDSSMVWFTRNPEVLTKIYEKVNARLKAERDVVNHLIAIRDNKPKESLPGDSIDVWAWQRMRRLTGMPIDNKLTFVLPSDSNFKKRDTLVWEVRYHFLERVKPDTTLYALMGMLSEIPDSTMAPIMAMQIVYKDSIISDIQKVYKSGMETVSLFADTLGEIREIRGYIYYPAAQATRTLLTDRISLMRYHATDTLSFAKNDSIQKDSVKTEKIEPQELKKEELKPVEEKINDNPRRRDAARPRPSSEPTLKKLDNPEHVQFRKDNP